MKRTRPFLVMGAGLLILLASGWLILVPPANAGVEGFLPGQIAGIPLSRTTSGSEAISEVGGMHGRRFPITSASIGHYGDRQATLWIAEAENSSSAEQMVVAMEQRIAEGNSPFTPLETLQDGDRTVFVLEGMGQSHYYFQSDNLVIWLAVDPVVSPLAIQQILEMYP